jgi:hypothetical protein
MTANRGENVHRTQEEWKQIAYDYFVMGIEFGYKQREKGMSIQTAAENGRESFTRTYGKADRNT